MKQMNLVMTKMKNKKYKWKCSTCPEKAVATKQPFCKTCSHIERMNVKMEKEVCDICNDSGTNGDGICLVCNDVEKVDD